MDTKVGVPPEATNEWRLTNLERRTQRLEDQDNYAAIRLTDQRVQDLRLRLEELHEDIVWLKRAILGAIFSLLAGMILFLFSISAGWLG